MAGFNRIPNRAFRLIAAWLPGFAVLCHQGRTSGRPYRTPVKLFRHDQRFVIACVYGAESDWVRNVLAAGGCELVHLGRRIPAEQTELVHDESRRLAPWIVRPIFRLLRVVDFLALTRATTRAETNHSK
jgi:deazaflavin-dependent oxidoreductase (nitroreductase family)